MRLFGAILVLMAIGVFAGCPQPITDEDTDNGTTINRDAAKPATSAAAQESDGESDDAATTKAAGDAAADETAETEAAADGDAVPADEADAPADEDSDAATDTTGAITFPGQNSSEAAADEPAEEPEDVLDPSTMLGDAADEPVEVEPPTPLDAVARAFSGDWAVIALNQDGHSRLAETDGEWVFALVDDGLCTISRELDGEASQQTGRWEFAADVLTLKLGPAHREYAVEQPRADVALFTDRTTDAVLFSLRIDPDERAPMLKSSYQLGGSELRFRSAGPGGYWRGTLTEPECSLLVRPIGKFVAGSWETPQDEGYVLLELSDDGFDGWWWYAASIEFDGVWRSGEE